MFAVYVLAFPYHPGLRSPNELCRLMQARAIVEFGDIDLNRAMQVYGPVGDLAVYRMRYYPSKAPLLSFGAVPIYLGLRAVLGGSQRSVSDLTLVYFARLLLNVLPTLLALVWMRRFLSTYALPLIADAVTLTYALGTLAFSYSLLFMSHQLSAVLLFAALYGLWRWSRDEWRTVGIVLSGAFASAAVAAEYTTAIGILGLGVFGILTLTERRASGVEKIRTVSLFLVGALPLTLLLMWYHTRAFGGPLETGYRHLADRAYQPWHEGGFLGVGLPQPRAFVLSLFSPLRGLFVLSPALVLAGPGVVLLFRRARSESELKPLAWTTLVVCLCYLYFTASFSYESWGWTTGPRHLTPLVPFLLLPVALALERASRTWLCGPCAVALGASVLLTSALTFVNYIPDNVSNAVGALALPLTRIGDFTPSLLSALGLPNPVSGVILWFGILAVFAWLLWSFRPEPSFASWVATLCAVAALVGFEIVTYRDTAGDRAALTLLERVWLSPPGRIFGLFDQDPTAFRERGH